MEIREMINMAVTAASQASQEGFPNTAAALVEIARLVADEQSRREQSCALTKQTVSESGATSG